MGPFRVHPGRMSIGALVVIDVHAKERGTVADESLSPNMKNTPYRNMA